jgi:octaprenyl-diphosphate synthase
MSQKDQVQKLKNEIKWILASVPDPSLKHLIKQAVSAKETNKRPWQILPLMVSECVGGSYNNTTPVAAALQLLNSAAEVFDDVEDTDNSDSIASKYGADLATNLGTCLMNLAYGELLKVEADPEIRLETIELINQYYTRACMGQHFDLLRKSELSEEQYYAIASLKTASVMECACVTGALLANPNKVIMENFGGFGQNLGIAWQIANDIQGIVSGIDIEKGKMTLPIIFMMETLEGLHKASFLEALQTDKKGVKERVMQDGGVFYARVKLEEYQNRAIDKLNQLESLGIKTNPLKIFLD